MMLHTVTRLSSGDTGAADRCAREVCGHCGVYRVTDALAAVARRDHTTTTPEEHT